MPPEWRCGEAGADRGIGWRRPFAAERRQIRVGDLPENYPERFWAKGLQTQALEKNGAPWGNRTPVLALRGPRPGPLDEGSLRCPPKARAGMIPAFVAGRNHDSL